MVQAGLDNTQTRTVVITVTVVGTETTKHSPTKGRAGRPEARQEGCKEIL